MLVAPQVHKFETGPFNWYLIEEGGRLTLVDAGFPGHYSVFRHGLESLGYNLGDLAGIVLTHAHGDHIGFAERVRRETGVPVFIHEDDLAKVQRPYQLPWIGLLSNAYRSQTFAMLVHATCNGVFWGPAVTEAQPLQDGQTLDLPGRPHILHVPGHTPGEIAVYLPERGVLISGDSIVTISVQDGGAVRPQLIPPALNYDTAQLTQSLDRLRDLGQVTLLSGHGLPWQGDMRAAVDQARGQV